MARLKGQSVSDARMPRGLRLVDESLPEQATAHTAVALPRDASVPPPATLPKRLHELWAEVTAPLIGCGLMAAADTPLVAVLVREIELYVIAADAARTEGPILINERGTPVANPANTAASQHASRILELSKSLGLTFVARARLDAPEGGGHKGAGNPFAV